MIEKFKNIFRKKIVVSVKMPMVGDEFIYHNAEDPEESFFDGCVLTYIGEADGSLTFNVNDEYAIDVKTWYLAAYLFEEYMAYLHPVSSLTKEEYFIFKLNGKIPSKFNGV